MPNELSKIVRVMNSIYGLDISMYDDTFLKQTTQKRFAAAETKNISQYILYLSSNKKEAQSLFDSLNIIYTEFFRNSLTFALLEQLILPQLIEQKPDNSELRVWSAGCAQGQEAYSIAMLIENTQKMHQKTFRYRIVATDISESALAAANKGEYNQDAIQNIRVKDLNKFFVKSGETHMVCSRLKKHVSFSTYDLLDKLSSCPPESIYGDFDIVMCSNVLLYYKTDVQRFIIDKLLQSIAPAGFLVTGEAESSLVANEAKLKNPTISTAVFCNNIRSVRP